MQDAPALWYFKRAKITRSRDLSVRGCVVRALLPLIKVDDNLQLLAEWLRRLGVALPGSEGPFVTGYRNKLVERHIIFSDLERILDMAYQFL